MKIDNNVPVPESRGRNTKYPLGDLEIGQSFFVDGMAGNSISSCIAHQCKKNPDKKFTRRTIEENGVKGVRVWRVK